MHGPVERLQRPVISDAGEYGLPHIAVDILIRLESAGAITQEERLGGERFREWFRLAHLDELRAADMARPFVDGGGAAPEQSFQAEHARNQINRAIRWVGGIESLSGGCLWSIIGLDQSFRKWANDQRSSRNISHLNARGALVVALERLSRMPWRGPFEESS